MYLQFNYNTFRTYILDNDWNGTVRCGCRRENTGTFQLLLFFFNAYTKGVGQR